jgi:hypothetical protein
MCRSCLATVAFPLLLVAVSGCESVKSSTPTSPSVAGPIAGVNIGAPKPVSPAANAEIRMQDQPVVLTVENVSTNSQRPLTYNFDIATDTAFTSKVLSREGITPGSDGKTAFRLPDALAGDRIYYWRSKAVDGANEGSYSAASAFVVVNLVEIQPPLPLAPISAVKVSSRSPQFIVQNSSRSGPAGAVSYRFEVAEDQAFGSPVAVFTVPEQTGQTKYTLTFDLKGDTKHYWRVRGGDSKVVGAWSLTQSFVTPAAPAPTPTPTPGPTTPPSGGWPTTGSAVVKYVVDRYPEKLVAGVSLSQRQDNMAFIRDRMIEAGICGGMDLGLNLKRGGPEISIDFLVHKVNGSDVGVDIGMDYDNTSIPLQVYWGAGAPGPYYKTYTPRPTCK